MFEILFIVVNRFPNSFYLIIGNINSLVKLFRALIVVSHYLTNFVNLFLAQMTSFLSLTFVLVCEIMFLRDRHRNPQHRLFV